MRKGQSTYVVSMIESFFGMMIVFAILNGTVFDTVDFVKAETVELNVERIDNAVKSLGSMPEGSIEMNVENHQFRYKEGKMALNYTGEINVSGKVAEKELSVRDNYDSVEGPSEFTEIESKLCIKKENTDEGKKLTFAKGEC